MRAPGDLTWRSLLITLLVAAAVIALLSQLTAGQIDWVRVIIIPLVVLVALLVASWFRSRRAGRR